MPADVVAYHHLRRVALVPVRLVWPLVRKNAVDEPRGEPPFDGAEPKVAALLRPKVGNVDAVHPIVIHELHRRVGSRVH